MVYEENNQHGKEEKQEDCMALFGKKNKNQGETR